MNFPISRARKAVVVAAALLALLGLGCGKKAGIIRPSFNERPSMTLTSAPVNEADTAFYAYKINWSANDPDGRVDYFLYAIDPKGGANPETTWIRTTKHEQIVFFSARNSDPNSGPIFKANEAHTFVIKAVDNAGYQSVPAVRSFFSYTVAPTVLIISPRPSAIGTANVTPAVRITWEGTDPDGQFSQKPVKYKYHLLHAGDPEFDLDFAKSHPDSLRSYYYSRNFAGWDSTSAETTTVQFTNLTPGSAYLFIVVAFDEAGAYSPDFSLYSNVLDMEVGLGALGPQFFLFNEFFNYEYPSGGFAPDDPLAWIELEVPGAQTLTFNWFGTPSQGASIEWYRWKVDGDVFDESPRTNQTTDWYHWSQKSVGTTSCTIGPFVGETAHFLYVEAMDNNGMLSCAVVHFKPVIPSFNQELLVVDDTRCEVDYNVNTTPTSPRRPYTSPWPAAAELDTFFYAVGGKPWLKTQAAITPLSKPGVFSGYAFDTVGTRKGYEVATLGVPLSLLGKYRHVLWITDQTAATKLGSSTDPIDGIALMRWMNTPGRSSTLSSYLYAGGNVWLAGGAVAYCSLIEFNKRTNDNLYGIGHTIFGTTAGELAPGRMMFDGARWQSDMAWSSLVVNPFRSSRAVGGWTSPGWNYQHPTVAPNYQNLPPNLRRRSVALGDSLPPTRTAGQLSTFIRPTATIAAEYLITPNLIIEDILVDVVRESLVSVMDTLFEFQGSGLATGATGQRAAAMTYYYGTAGPPFIFTGFSLWEWTKADCVGLVDFVLHDIWGLNRAPGAPNRLAAPLRASYGGSAPALTGATQTPATKRANVGRARGW